MQRCIELAQNGLGTTYPNPLVGSVIVHNNTIIGEGWHYESGKPHAEVHAITSVKDASLFAEATIYVSLEPCSHYGKTPPCASLILEKGIKKVVVGTLDPFPEVAGRGIEMLRNGGCEVSVGILEEECKELNKRFLTFQQKKRPYIFLKWAETKNGFVAPKQRDKKAPVWISNELSRQFSHQLRAQEAAILVGTQTVLDDNPSLTLRNWAGTSPIRIIIDRKGVIPSTASIFNTEATTIVLTEMPWSQNNHVHFEQLNFTKEFLPQLFSICEKHQIQSLIIEGGKKTLDHFISNNCWDEAYKIVGDATFNEGTPAPKFFSQYYSKKELLNDTLFHYKNSSPC